MSNPSVDVTVTVDTSSTHIVSRFESVNSLFDKVNNAVERGAEDGAEALGEKVADMQREFLAVGGHIITGELYNSISSVGGGLSYTIGSTLGDEAFSPSVIEYGRGEVYPVNCQFLHYVDGRTGKEVFSRYSRAYAGDPYVSPSAEYGASVAHETVWDSINGWL